MVLNRKEKFYKREQKSAPNEYVENLPYIPF